MYPIAIAKLILRTKILVVMLRNKNIYFYSHSFTGLLEKSWENMSINSLYIWKKLIENTGSFEERYYHYKMIDSGHLNESTSYFQMSRI